MDNYKDFDTKSLTSSHGQVPNLTGVGDSHFLLADSDASQMSKPSYLQDKFKQVSIGLKDICFDLVALQMLQIHFHFSVTI